MKIQSHALLLFVGLVGYARAQRGRPYVEPLWYPRLEAEDETGLLARCRKRTMREAPPKDGDLCARKPKICYFGTQDCDGVGAHPEIMCVCDGRDGTMKWQCEEEFICPTNPTRGCPAPGEELDWNNDPSCPEEDPSSELLEEAPACPSDGGVCNYGIIDCCGLCFSVSQCDCSGFGSPGELGCFVDLGLVYVCSNGDFCRLRFPGVISGSCIEARTAIFARFPGVKVICQKEFDPEPTIDNLPVTLCCWMR